MPPPYTTMGTLELSGTSRSYAASGTIRGLQTFAIFWVCSSWNINRQLRSPLQGWKLQEHRLKKENIMNLLHMTES
jgi:hypothetical protein